MDIWYLYSFHLQLNLSHQYSYLGHLCFFQAIFFIPHDLFENVSVKNPFVPVTSKVLSVTLFPPFLKFLGHTNRTSAAQSIASLQMVHSFHSREGQALPFNADYHRLLSAVERTWNLLIGELTCESETLRVQRYAYSVFKLKLMEEEEEIKT